MRLPHQKYLQYLHLMELSYTQVEEECSSLSLVSPNKEEWAHIITSTRKNKHWNGEYNPDNGRHTYKVQSLDLVKLFHPDQILLDAQLFLNRSKIRKDFEVLSLTLPTIEEVLTELTVKYPKHFLPSIEALETFVSIFWNLGLLTSDEMFSFLARHHGNKAALIPASIGDVTTAYSRIGIPETITPETFYNNIVALANTQITQARMAAELITGSQLMGIAAITRQGLDAMRAKSELDNSDRVEVLDSIRAQAAAFHVQMDVGEDIITLDELQEENNERPTLTVVSSN